MTAKTAAQRQASRKSRLQAAGLVRFSRWVHADDVHALREYAERLAKKRNAALTGARDYSPGAPQHVARPVE